MRVVIESIAKAFDGTFDVEVVVTKGGKVYKYSFTLPTWKDVDTTTLMIAQKRFGDVVRYLKDTNIREKEITHGRKDSKNVSTTRGDGQD